MSQFLNNREKKIFGICLAVVFLAVFYNGLIVPLQGEVNSLHQEIALQKKQLDKSFRVIQKAAKLNTQYDRYWERFGKAGSGEEVVSSILSEIEKVARTHELHIAELKPQKIKHNELDDQFSVHLTMNSELIDVIRFLYTLQQAPYLFDVEEVEFKKSARRKQGKITTRLVLGKTFILTDPNERYESQRGANIPL